MYAQSLNNAVWTNQFDNRANRDGHFISTGPEIWSQTEGKVDGFVCATGTGGTLAGGKHYKHSVLTYILTSIVAAYLKMKNPGIKVYLADPPGSVLFTYIKSQGKLVERSGSSITEGIGQGRVTNNLGPDLQYIDDAVQIPDTASIELVYRLLDEEGIYVGASSALNVAAAVEVAKKLGPGHNIVTLLCDGAYRYQSRLFSKKWLKQKNLFSSLPNNLKHYAVLE